MALNFPVKGGGGDFKSLASGSYIALCDMVVFLGLQPGSGLYPDPKYQVYIRFQVPSERIEFERDGKKINGPAVIGQAFTASMHKKARVRLMLEQWRGKTFTDEEAAAFDVSSILGKPCMLGVTEKESGGKIYSNITSVGLPPRGVPVPAHEGNLIYYADDNKGTYSSLPNWLKEKIGKQLGAVHSDASGDQDVWEQLPPVEAYANVHGVDIDDNDLPTPF
jgi:hypothetical protein